MYFDVQLNAAGNGWERYTGTHHACGLHGLATVDPDGEQMNLNNRGSCWFAPAQRQPQYVQLELDLF